MHGKKHPQKSPRPCRFSRARRGHHARYRTPLSRRTGRNNRTQTHRQPKTMARKKPLDIRRKRRRQANSRPLVCQNASSRYKTNRDRRRTSLATRFFGVWVVNNMDKLGLKRRKVAKTDVCPRCGQEFRKEHLMVYGGCLTDMDRANKGLPHCTTRHLTPKLTRGGAADIECSASLGQKERKMALSDKQNQRGIL